MEMILLMFLSMQSCNVGVCSCKLKLCDGWVLHGTVLRQQTEVLCFVMLVVAKLCIHILHYVSIVSGYFSKNQVYNVPSDKLT